MSVRSSFERGPRASCKWETVRYALDSTARTVRLCVILLVLVTVPTLLMLLAWR
jgi:hypothetical protein